jgi:DNA-binding NarL/FixJ family response regulator
MSERRPSVAVVGQRGMVRDLVAHVFEAAGQLRCVGDPHEELDLDDVDVVAVLEPGADGLGIEARPAVVIRTELRDADVLADLRRGADGILSVDLSAEEMLRAVAVVAAGGCWAPEPAMRAIVDALRRSDGADAPVSLTAREQDILRCVSDGLSVKQTARALGVAPKTVENLQSRLFRKLGVRNRAQAVARAVAGGLLSEPLGESPPT